MAHASEKCHQLEFLQLRMGDYNFYHAHASVLALQDEQLFQQWVELEKVLAERKLLFYKAELTKICKLYGIDLGRSRTSFKFPHQDKAVPINDDNICHDLAQHAFANARTLSWHSQHYTPAARDLPMVREYARVLEPEERIRVAVLVQTDLLM
jgi:hypothetical protein